MGGPRASTIRQRERGQRCAACESWLGGPAWVNLGQRLCTKCAPSTVRIYMSFFSRGLQGGSEWVCGFLESDLKTSICRSRTFASAQKLQDLVERTPTVLSDSDQRSFAYDLERGRGGVWLEVTAEQYARLRGC